MEQRAPAGFEWAREADASPATHSIIVSRGGQLLRCKRLSSRANEDDGARARMAREACILQLLAGRGAPELVASGLDAHGPYVVMDEVAMTPLSNILSLPPLGLAALMGVALRTLAALARVHEARDAGGPLAVVHGDLSPDNVLADDARAVIVDFGLSGFRDQPLVPAAVFAGTLRYAAPELARGEHVDQRADVFAIAATLLHVASRLPPREAASAGAMLMQAGSEPMDGYLASCAGRVPRELLALLAPCLAFDPAMRPASAATIAR